MSETLIGAIWAQTPEGVIGADGQMPWHVPEDLTHFKETTAGSPVIMGRKTWESLPEQFRPLPKRINIVITRDADRATELQSAGAMTASSLEEAIELGSAQASGPDPMVWIMGGGAIYAEAVEKDLIDIASVTTIETPAPGDTYAPQLNADKWEQAEPTPEWETSQTGLRYRFNTYRRRGLKKSRGSKVAAILMIVLGSFLFLASAAGNRATEERSGDTAYLVTGVVLNVLLLLIVIWGIVILVRKPRRR